MTALLALAASVLWGASDFAGGLCARRYPLLSVVAVSQLAGMVFMLAVAVPTGHLDAPLGYLPWALGSGLVGCVALLAFYRALATGTMGVVAPIAALGVAVPVAVGLGEGDSPGPVQLAGLALAVCGVVLASGPEVGRSASRRSVAASWRPLVLSVVAALGFGSVIVFVVHGSRVDVDMTLLVMRGVSAAVVCAVIVARSPAAGGRRRLDIRSVATLAAVGGVDLAANACYAVASQRGLLSLVAVLSSLYPAITVLLAWRVLGERLRPVQTTGVIGALAGVVLIAAGGGGA
jgi:drug/metabolite transporter (DMT)-like permease